MTAHRSSVIAALFLAVLLSACRPAAAAQVIPAPADRGVQVTPMPSIAGPQATAQPQATGTPEPAMPVPGWYGVALTDARTAQVFSISEFSDRVVLVETIAVWCTKCRAQQAEIQRLHGLLGDRPDLVSISLDIDPFEDLSFLQQYVAQSGFSWHYAIAPRDLARELAALYGDQFLNPPSTPILIIDRHGQAHALEFGLKSAEQLLQAVQPFLDEPV